PSFLDNLAVQAGLEIIGKGGKIDDGGFSEKISLLYLEIPIHALYLYPLPGKKLLFGGLGPYFAYGLSGKVKDGGNSINAFDKSKGGFRRFYAGLSLTAGCWLNNRIVASLRYDLGLANLSSDPQFEKIRNRSLVIYVGYSVGGLETWKLIFRDESKPPGCWLGGLLENRRALNSLLNPPVSGAFFQNKAFKLPGSAHFEPIQPKAYVRLPRVFVWLSSRKKLVFNLNVLPNHDYFNPKFTSCQSATPAA
ncbi:MAG: PorT family protein, partial [Cytophagaceae bacterium]|nr:PorT family protein [Cytophagaceae bacterium]